MTLSADLADDRLVFYFSQKIEFDILCKLSPLETICLESQILFSGKNKKKKMFQIVVCWNFYPACKALIVKLDYVLLMSTPGVTKQNLETLNCKSTE